MTSGDQGKKKSESKFAPESERTAPQNLASNSDWRLSWPYFADAMQRLIGTDSPSAIARYFGRGLSDQNVRDWRRGRCGIPAWVIATAQQHVAATGAALNRIVTAPGAPADIASKRRGDRWAKRKSPAP